MIGKFGIQRVLLSYCEWDDYSNKVFVDEEAFEAYFSSPSFLQMFDDGDETYDSLMDQGLLGYEVVEVIGT